MKASKIRIVFILLLIIFFGLLILFGYRNIYEGATNVNPALNPLKDKPTKESGALPLKFVKPSNTLVAGAGSGAKPKLGTTIVPNPKPTNFISVYYYFPNKYIKNFNTADLPIIYLFHNITDYNVYFCNSKPFCPQDKGQPSASRIYIESKTNTKEIKKPKKFWKEYAVANKDALTFNKWIGNQSWSGDETTVNFKEATYSEKLVSSTNNINGSSSNSPYSAPPDNALNNLLPLKYDKTLKKDSDKKTTMYFDARYSSANITKANISIDNNNDTNTTNGVVCLAIYYFTFA
jgi:hypothetical protein